MKGFLLLFAMFTMMASAEPAESRIWTSTAGTTIQAKATAVEKGIVVFAKEDGSILRVPLNKLIAADQSILADYFKTDTVAPSATVTGEVPAGKAPDNLGHPLGQTTEEIDAGDGAHYFLYLPQSLVAAKEYPILFIMDPGGGKAATADRYIKGAERNGWLLAVSKESSNGHDGAVSTGAIKAMIKHVKKTLPVDKARIYFSGFSGGCREAFAFGNKERATGVIACGAGAASDYASTSTVVYGLCGSNCFNRWDMACTFKRIKNRASILRFFIGNHEWANEELIDDAMTYLNLIHLEKSKNADERLRCETSVVKLISEIQESDAQRACMWSSFLTERGVSPGLQHGLSVLHQGLVKDAHNVTYATGLKEIQKFAVRHFGDSPMSYLDNNPNTEVANACNKLAADYAGTQWEDILSKMAAAAPKP